jgi:hypothetical protein
MQTLRRIAASSIGRLRQVPGSVMQKIAMMQQDLGLVGLCQTLIDYQDREDGKLLRCVVEDMLIYAGAQATIAKIDGHG